MVRKAPHKDPICGMEGKIRAHGHWFCSVGCIRKFERQARMEKDLYCAECEKEGRHKKKKWHQERLYQVLMFTGGLLGLSLILGMAGIAIMDPFWSAFYDYTALIWWAVLLGFVLGGVIDYLIPREYISKFLSKREKRTIGWSVLLGFMMSACSHGILAISMELYKKGASVSSVVAFLLASPWANLPITLLLFSLFGWNALYFVVFAIIIALATGLIYQVLEAKGWVERSKHTVHVSEDFSVKDDMKARWKAYRKRPNNTKVVKGILVGSWSLTKMVMWWVLVGVILAAAARAFIQPELFMAYLGPTLLGLFATLLLATVIEVCSEGSSPLAFEIYRQTGAFGNSFTFLMAGVVTDYTEIGLIASNIGRRAAMWLPIITVPMVLLLGYIFNMLI